MRRLIVQEPVSRAALWSRGLALFALASAGVAIGLSRAGAATPASALTVFGAALTLAFLALLLSASAAVVIWRTGRRGVVPAATGCLLSLALIAYPAFLTVLAVTLPAVTQVSTDIDNPPGFMMSARARAARANTPPPVYTPDDARAQRSGYPDVQPVLVDLEALQAYQLSMRVARDLGWRIVDSTPPNLRGDGVAHIDALDKTLFFGFSEDIAIRITPQANQTRIDIRAVSRLGKHDFGANARRIRKFAAAAQDSTEQR